jgi:Uma2 family endonuclease
MNVSLPRTRRWTKAEYHRMRDLGFFDNQRVELIQGRIVQMPAMKNLHVTGVGLTEDALRAAFGPKHWVRIQAPLDLPGASEPEPDLAVVPGGPRDYTDHPKTALLIVEVSDTTLRYDRTRKGAIYARAGIADYWIVNLVDTQLEIYRDPQRDPKRRRRFTYTQVTVHKAGDRVTALAAPKATIAVADLLP